MNKSLKACLLILSGAVALAFLVQFHPDIEVMLLGLGCCIVAGIFWWVPVIFALLRSVARGIRGVAAWSRNLDASRHG